MKSNFVYVGPVPPPYHGQSLAFAKFLEVAPVGRVISISSVHNTFWSKFISNVAVLIKLVSLIFTIDSNTTIYFTCSRSYLGSLRDIVLLLIVKVKRCRVINHLHGADFSLFYYRVSPLYRRLIDYSYSAVSEFIILSESMRTQFDMFEGASSTVVNNFYDTQLDSYSIESKTVKSSEAVEIVYLSNLMTVKGVFVLLDALELINKKGVNVRLKIAGEFLSDYESDATAVKRRFFDRIKLLNNVEYLGVVSGSDKFDLLVSSDIFVLPTYHRSEAVPLSIFEAMAAGCSVITTNHNFLPDIVCKEGAILVEPRDRHSLAEAIFAYVSSPDLMASHKLANIEFAKVHYSESVYKERLLSILKK